MYQRFYTKFIGGIDQSSYINRLLPSNLTCKFHLMRFKQIDERENCLKISYLEKKTKKNKAPVTLISTLGSFFHQNGHIDGTTGFQSFNSETKP